MSLIVLESLQKQKIPKLQKRKKQQLLMSRSRRIMMAYRLLPLN